MNWTVGKKMFLVGVFAVLGVIVLAGNNYLTNTSIAKTSELTTQRYQQIETVNRTLQAQLNLMLAAMDSIVDKDEGKVDEERMEEINKSAAFIKDNLKGLDELADTEEEKRLSNELYTLFKNLSSSIQVDLVKQIENSGTRMAEIEAEFSKIHDVLYIYGDGIGDSLAGLEASLQEKLKNASDSSNSYKEQIDTLNYMRMSLLKIMMSAMNSIIDKDEGWIIEERMEVINTNVGYLTENMDALDKMAETEEEKGLVETARDALPYLAEGVQVDLGKLIEKSAAEATQIKAAFAEIDDMLDENGKKLEDNLRKIQASVKEELYEAQEASEKMLTRSRMVGWIASLAALVVVVTALLLISRSIINPITQVSRGLNEGAEQVASASGQISSSSQQLAEGSSEQAASIEETSSSLEEMASMTKQNADNAGQADNLMHEANQVVRKADDSMTEVIRSMEEISKASEETSKIIKTIDEIAFQTNLLALNAAVEAARAGEAGAGFAVVADEVRNLAMRAADAAKNTADLIEETVKKVKDGGDLVASTNEAFTEVATSAAKVGELVGEIAAASKEQAEGIEQVNKAVIEMDKVVQQNAANAEESASASEEMNAQAEQMKGLVGELISLVDGSANGAGVKRSAVTREQEIDKKPLLDPENRAIGEEVAVDKINEVSPNQVIPLDKADFKDF